MASSLARTAGPGSEAARVARRDVDQHVLAGREQSPVGVAEPVEEAHPLAAALDDLGVGQDRVADHRLAEVTDAGFGGE